MALRVGHTTLIRYGSFYYKASLFIAVGHVETLTETPLNAFDSLA
jgi:hypothetical protein